jgi:hypothetical protein
LWSRDHAASAAENGILIINTLLPKILGAARLYEMTGQQRSAVYWKTMTAAEWEAQPR